MAPHHLAPSLHRLRAEVNDLWPGRDKTSDGWIGDTSHSARKSDHNPAPPTGVVRALDIDKDGIDKGAIVAVAIQDHRVEYVIFEGLIYQRKYGFKPRKYTGANSHHGHVHISIRHGARYEQDSSAWGIATPASSAVGGATSRPGQHLPTPTFPTVQEDEVLTTEQDNALARILQIGEALVGYTLDQNGRGYQADARVLGVLPDKRNADKSVATVLTTTEGQVLRDDIAASTARAVAETSAAYHQLVAAIGGIEGGDVDVDRLAAALKTTLGSAVADELATRLKGA